MLLSISLILFFGFIFGQFFRKINLPSLIGMLVVGIALGPYLFNLLDDSILSISSEIRKIALIIILTRAGLNLNLDDLKRIGRPALLLSFVPACFEIMGITIFAPIIFDLSLIESLILGSVIAAVSPAVVVPRMVKLIDDNKGCKKSIPQMILAGASLDDVFVIALFTSFISLSNNEFSFVHLMNVPISIILGIIVGIFIGYVLSKLFNHFDSIYNLIILFSITLFVVYLEDIVNLPFASLISVMSIGITLKELNTKVSNKLSNYYSKLWIIGENFLFVLVGASVNINYAIHLGILPIVLLILSLIFRLIGVLISLYKTNLNIKEKIFSIFAYMPKATVQAAIGGLPLAYGLNCGETVLTIAVVSILFTAPIGAIFIDATSKFLE